jgi:hypothetical protein
MPPTESLIRPLVEGPDRCPICHEPVEIAKAKTNEDGQAVHEECYVRMLCQTQNITSQES